MHPVKIHSLFFVRRERNQFRRVFANLIGIGRGPVGVDPHVATDGPA